MPPENDEPTEQAPATPPSGETEVKLSKAEHDRIQAENRRMRKELAKREEADQSAASRREIEEATARKDFDAALEVSRREQETLRRQLRDARAADALRDEIERRGVTGSRASAMRRLASQVEFDEDGFPDEESVRSAIDAVAKDYPDLFEAPSGDGEEPEAEETPRRRMRRAAGPATPPQQSAMPDGYVSPEDYERTPPHIRTSPEFQKRVRLSQPLWPGFHRDKKISARTFAVGQ